MPLPKPPSKKGDLLHSDDYEAQAAPRAGKRSLKTRTAEATTEVALELHDGAVAVAARPAVAKGMTATVARLAVVPSAVAAPRPQAQPAAPTPAAKPRKPRHVGPPKLFVLDTNVLMHDPMSLFRFEEHDVFLPMIYLLA